MLLRIALCCLAVWLTAGPASAQEWTRFRGPNGTGVSTCKTIPVQWQQNDEVWRVELPGLGHSSPVVWGDKVFVLSADPEKATRYVLCHSAVDGRNLWTKEFPSATHHLHVRSSYASCTPTVDAELVYVGWSTPEETTLLALNHAGEQKWRLNLGRWVSQHGFGTSPILFEDLVILHNSQDAEQLEPGVQPGDSFMMAFDRQTGQERWRTPLKSRNVSYSVPFIYEGGGQPQLVCTSTGDGMFGLDPRSGKMNWSVADAFVMRTVSSPILAGGRIFGSNGSGAYSGNYLAAIDPTGEPKVAYQLKNSAEFKAPYVPCLIARGDKVFCIYDRGFAACIDAATGKVHWLDRTGGEFSSSPILVNDKIYCVDENGVVWVIAADETAYKLLAKNPLGEPSRSTPAVSGGRIFFRTYSQLICVGGSPQAAGG